MLQHPKSAEAEGQIDLLISFSQLCFKQGSWLSGPPYGSNRLICPPPWCQVHAVEEVEEFVGKVSALVINVGTLSKDWVSAMHLAAQEASKHGKPWVLDPVGAGATQYRTKVRRWASCPSHRLALETVLGYACGSLMSLDLMGTEINRFQAISMLTAVRLCKSWWLLHCLCACQVQHS